MDSELCSDHFPSWARGLNEDPTFGLDGAKPPTKLSMEERIFKIVNNCFNTNIYSYLETSGGPSYNPYLNIVHFLTPVLIRHLWQLRTVVFLHCCLICTVLMPNNMSSKNPKCYTISYPNEEVNRTDPSPSASVPWTNHSQKKCPMFRHFSPRLRSIASSHFLFVFLQFPLKNKQCLSKYYTILPKWGGQLY
jgi:hypothetical protein